MKAEEIDFEEKAKEFVKSCENISAWEREAIRTFAMWLNMEFEEVEEE